MGSCSLALLCFALLYSSLLLVNVHRRSSFFHRYSSLFVVAHHCSSLSIIVIIAHCYSWLFMVNHRCSSTFIVTIDAHPCSSLLSLPLFIHGYSSLFIGVHRYSRCSSLFIAAIFAYSPFFFVMARYRIAVQ